MITNVVVPVDGSPLAASAIGPACALAEATGASLGLLTAEPLVLWHERLEEAKEYLEKKAADTGLPGVETLVVGDKTARQAILVESQTRETVVCMATHGRSGVGHAVLGSVAEAVLRDSGQPLLLVGPATACASPAWRGGNLLVAVDGSPASAAIIPVAAEWAEMLELRPWVVEVIPEQQDITNDSRERAVESATVRGVARRLGDVALPAQWEVLHKPEAADALVDYATRLPAVLIAMATHGRTGLGRAALGSVAMQVVHRSACPVLVVRSPNIAE
jgi:nucleotide-binding universal stress UspA family protein